LAWEHDLTLCGAGTIGAEPGEKIAVVATDLERQLLLSRRAYAA